MNRDEGFVSRWARRKAQVRAGLPVDEPPPPATEPVAPPPAAVNSGPTPVAPAPAETSATAAPEATATAPAPAAEPMPVPTMDDVAALARDAADFSRFVAPQVPAEVRNAAMKKLFTDPHFNVMDGLDVYIDDYSKPDPVPRSMLRSLVQSRLLGLFDDEPQPTPAPVAAADAAAAAASAPEPVAEPEAETVAEPPMPEPPSPEPPSPAQGEPTSPQDA